MMAGSDVVVELELVRVRAQLHGEDLLGALEVDPGLDQVGREHVALGEEVVVALEVVEYGVERGRDLVDLMVCPLISCPYDGQRPRQGCTRPVTTKDDAP